MRALRKLQAVLVLSATLAFAPAQAVLISADDPAFGAGAVTIDTETGLQWLDLTVTTAVSMNAVAASIAGGALQGWHFATAAEVTQLWDNAGVPLPIAAPGFPTFAFGSAQNNAALALIDLLGLQWVMEDQTGSLGFILELSTVSPRWWQVFAATAAGADGSTSASFLIGTFDTPSPRIGSYLVRDANAVPEPATASVLLLAALLVFAVRARSAARRSSASTR